MFSIEQHFSDQATEYKAVCGAKVYHWTGWGTTAT